MISFFDGAAGLMLPGYCEGMVDCINLSVSEWQLLKWVNSVEVFCTQCFKARQMELLRDAAMGKNVNVKQRDRERIAWHMRDYAKRMLVAIISCQLS